MRKLKTLTDYKSDESGQFAIWFAVVATPLLLSVGFALELTNMNSRQASMQSALDAAALAAVANQNITDPERARKAEDVFWTNVPNRQDISIDVLDSSSLRVLVQGTDERKSFMPGFAGKNRNQVVRQAEAVITEGSVICLLALDPVSKHSFEVSRGANLNAKCGVQVNSNHKEASIVKSGGKANAEDFCITGGASGNYRPYANTECSMTPDPYRYLKLPLPTGPCIDTDLSDSKKRIGDLTLEPGLYCDGLSFFAGNITLNPGVYHISDGSVIFEKGVRVEGDGVTFVMHGDSNVEMRAGAKIDLKAPNSGETAGLIFAQEMDGRPRTSLSYPSANSSVTNGGNVKLIGTVYLPTHKFEFAQGGKAETQAPATSFIAYQLLMSQGAKVSVEVNHNLFEMPPILPRSDESVRLVR